MAAPYPVWLRQQDPADRAYFEQRFNSYIQDKEDAEGKTRGYYSSSNKLGDERAEFYMDPKVQEAVFGPGSARHTDSGETLASWSSRIQPQRNRELSNHGKRVLYPQLGYNTKAWIDPTKSFANPTQDMEARELFPPHAGVIQLHLRLG